MQVFVLLVCFVALINARVVEVEDNNPYRFSKHLDAIAKEVNSRDDVLWIAYDPEMSALEYNHRMAHIENKIATLAKTSPRFAFFDVLEETHPGFLEQANPAASKDYSSYVRTPENQGQCGSCWAFSTVHAFNDYIAIANGVSIPDLSIQEVLTCCTGEGCGGCNGGYLVASYNYMARYGTPSASCKRYNQFPGRCLSQCDSGSAESAQTHYFPNNYNQFTGSGMVPIVQALQVAPASGSMIVYEDFMRYNGGVYHHVSGSQQGGHAIEIVGYGGTGASSYWIVKNSWGTSWGTGGFFRIRSGNNECNFERMERGYNQGTGYRQQVKNFPQPKFTTLDAGDPQPVDELDPAGDEVTTVEVDDVKVLEAAQHAASQLNPVHCAGNVTLVSVLNAESQIVSGVKYLLTIVVNSATCVRGAEVFFVNVYMDPLGEYSLSDSYSMGPYVPADTSGQVDSYWRTLAGVFIGISAITLFVAIGLGCRIAGTPAVVSPQGESGSTYHRLDHEL